MASSLYISLLALIYLALSVNVIKGRRIAKIAIGDGNNDNMRQKIRAHGNFIEYTPFFLIMLLCVEYNGLPKLFIHIFGLIFILGRIFHAYAILKEEKYLEEKITNKPLFRVKGMICTFTSIGILAIILIIQYLIILFR
jgi:hypothetical protein